VQSPVGIAWQQQGHAEPGRRGAEISVVEGHDRVCPAIDGGLKHHLISQISQSRTNATFANNWAFPSSAADNKPEDAPEGLRSAAMTTSVSRTRRMTKSDIAGDVTQAFASARPVGITAPPTGPGCSAGCPAPMRRSFSHRGGFGHFDAAG
jgi:hypothetical protein